MENEDTGLRVWFRDEIRNVLLAVLRSQMMALELNAVHAPGYREGILVAISAIATAFGIDLSQYVKTWSAGDGESAIVSH